MTSWNSSRHYGGVSVEIDLQITSLVPARNGLIAHETGDSVPMDIPADGNCKSEKNTMACKRSPINPA